MINFEKAPKSITMTMDPDGEADRLLNESKSPAEAVQGMALFFVKMYNYFVEKRQKLFAEEHPDMPKEVQNILSEIRAVVDLTISNMSNREIEKALARRRETVAKQALAILMQGMQNGACTKGNGNPGGVH